MVNSKGAKITNCFALSNMKIFLLQFPNRLPEAIYEPTKIEELVHLFEQTYFVLWIFHKLKLRYLSCVEVHNSEVLKSLSQILETDLNLS